MNARNAPRRGTAPEVHAYSYTLSRRGQWHGVVRANGHETESRPFAQKTDAQAEAGRMLSRVLA